MSVLVSLLICTFIGCLLGSCFGVLGAAYLVYKLALKHEVQGLGYSEEDLKEMAAAHAARKWNGNVPTLPDDDLSMLDGPQDAAH